MILLLYLQYRFNTKASKNYDALHVLIGEGINIVKRFHGLKLCDSSNSNIIFHAYCEDEIPVEKSLPRQIFFRMYMMRTVRKTFSLDLSLLLFYNIFERL